MGDKHYPSSNLASGRFLTKDTLFLAAGFSPLAEGRLVTCGGETSQVTGSHVGDLRDPQQYGGPSRVTHDMARTNESGCRSGFINQA